MLCFESSLVLKLSRASLSENELQMVVVISILLVEEHLRAKRGSELLLLLVVYQHS